MSGFALFLIYAYTVSMSVSSVGIDAIALAVPTRFITLDELALARGVSPEKYKLGLGVEKMAVPGPEEDPVALAANAARQLFRSSGNSPQEIGLCVVGTETPVDHAKPIAVYLQRMLGLPNSCRAFDTKHACYGGTAGLFAALDWITSGSARGKSALVVCTDIARYPLGSPGEPTQGAGAIALLISHHPRLLTIDPAAYGTHSNEVYDFWRPLRSEEATTNGPLSIKSYLEALTYAYSDWKKQNPNHPNLIRSCYHVPYGKMARKAHYHRLSIDNVGPLTENPEEEVAASLIFPAQVGNIYTGSLYLALASLLHHEASSLQGHFIGLFSYGSGCIGQFFAGQVSYQASATMQKLQVAQSLQHREQIDVATYESLRFQGTFRNQEMAFPETSPDLIKADSSKNIVFLGTDKAERRLYQNVPIPISTANTNR